MLLITTQYTATLNLQPTIESKRQTLQDHYYTSTEKQETEETPILSILSDTYKCLSDKRANKRLINLDSRSHNKN